MARNKQTQNTPIPLEQQPFRLPENWQWVRLGNVVQIKRGASPRPIKAYVTDDENGVNWIKIGDTDTGKYITKIKEKITPLGAEKSVFVNKGTLLLSNSMSFGKPYILKVDGCIHDGWLSLTPSKVVDKEFLYYALLSSERYFESVAVGTAVRNLNSERVSTTPIPLPPLVEQKRIVEKIEQLFTQLDQAAEKLTAVIDGFELRKTTILHKAFTGKLVPQNLTDEPAQTLLQRIQQEKQTCSGSQKKQKQYAPMKQNEPPFRLPENWVWVYLVSGFDITSSKRVHKKDWLSQGVPFYRTRELVKLSEYGYVDNELFISQELYDEFAEKYGVPAVGDLLVSGVGTIGVPYIVNDKKPFYFKDGNVIWLKNKGLFNPKYVFYFYKSEFMYNYIHNMSAGTTVDTYTIINATKTPIPLPPLAEQKRIVEKIEQLLEPSIQAKQQAEDALQKIALIKKAILAQAFRGEL